jgi:hypothetical protein
VSFSADLRFDSGSWSAAGNYLMFMVADLNTTALRAGAFVTANQVRYLVYQGNTSREVTHTIPADTAFHRYTLTVDASGTSSWSRDGVLQQTIPDFPSTNLYVRITGPSDVLDVPGVGHADNVLVTEP